MLSSDFGGVRPWEIELLKPAELRDMYRYARELERERAKQDG